MSATEAARLRKQLALARSRLFATEVENDRREALDIGFVTDAIQRFGERRPRLSGVLLRATKLPVWLVAGQLPRQVRSWRRNGGDGGTGRSPEAAMVNESGSLVSTAAAGPAAGAGHVLIADESVCKPDQSAGFRCVMSTIRALRGAGWAVTLWAHDRHHGGHYTRELEALGVGVLDARWTGTFEAWLADHGGSLDHVMLLRPHIAKALLPSVLRLATAGISYQGIDLHFARLARTAQQFDDPFYEFLSERSLALERSIWRVVDVVLYLSDEEVAEVRRLEPEVEARVLAPFTYETFVSRPVATPGRTLLFVGGFSHPPNADAVWWFTTEVLPRVREAEPDTRLVIIGSKTPPAVQRLASDHVVVRGYVDDAALAAAYAEARVAVAPLRIGAGVKGKVVEAMAQGVPVVTTPTGAQGMPGLADFVPVCNGADAFAAAVVALLREDGRWLAQSAAQTAYAQRHYSTAALHEVLFATVRRRPDAPGGAAGR